MFWRTSSSAVDVTVQVFRTTRSASPGTLATVKPEAARPASIAAPSACDARQPKFLTQNRSTELKLPPSFNFSVQGSPAFQTRVLEPSMQRGLWSNACLLRDGYPYERPQTAEVAESYTHSQERNGATAPCA